MNFKLVCFVYILRLKTFERTFICTEEEESKTSPVLQIVNILHIVYPSLYSLGNSIVFYFVIYFHYVVKFKKTDSASSPNKKRDFDTVTKMDMIVDASGESVQKNLQI